VPTPTSSATPGPPRHPTFRILHADCGTAPAIFDFFVNDTPIGSAASASPCDCSTEPLEVTFSDDATLPPSTPGLCDVYRVEVRGGGAGVRIGFVEVSVDTPDGPLDGCLFDGSATNPMPTCAARSVCDPPGFSETVPAITGSVCPLCGTAAASTVAQDLDGDRIGNTCDDTDAALTVRRGSVHRNTGRIMPNGTITIVGQVQLAAPTDSLDVTDGLLIRVNDGFELDKTFTFLAGECTRHRSGYINCKSADAHSHAILAPVRRGARRFRVSLRFDHLALMGSFQPDLTVRMTNDPPQAGEGIDRIGVVGNCTVTPNGMHCRALQ